VAVDRSGNVYVADTGNHAIRKIANDAQHTVTTIAGTGKPGRGTGAGAQAMLNVPVGIAVGSDGSLLVTDSHNSRIVRIANDSLHTVSTWAGSPSGANGQTDGNGTAARFFYPTGIVAVGSDLYVADTRNNRVRRIDAARNVTTVVGAAGAGLSDGSGSSARMKFPTGIAAAGGALYVVDTGNRRIRRVALDGTYATRTLAGTGIGGFADGAAATALLMPWGGVAVLGSDVFVGDTGNSRIRLLRNGRIGTFAGDGRAGSIDGAGPVARFMLPSGMAALADGTLVVADEGASTIRLVGGGVGGGTGGGASPDAGTGADAGAADAGGPPDAGTPDAGAPDAGSADAGSGPKPPTAAITGGPFVGRAPLSVFLDATSTRSANPGGWIKSFHWDLGNGTTSTRGYLYQTYTTPGRYVVIVQATDELGHVGVAQQVITVN
jgi:sugar lactone lactonase YvrE